MVSGSWLMAQAHGSCLKARGSRPRRIWRQCLGSGGPSAKFLSLPSWATSLEACAMSHESLTINNRLIHEFLDSILQVLCITGNQSQLLWEPPRGVGGTARPVYLNELLIRDSKTLQGKPDWGTSIGHQFMPAPQPFIRRLQAFFDCKPTFLVMVCVACAKNLYKMSSGKLRKKGATARE